MGLIVYGILALIIILALCKVSPAFQYKFKFCLFAVYVPIGALITIPFFALRPKDVRNMHWLTPIYRRASPLLGIKWEIRGREILEKDEARVFVCNHQTGLDILAMAELAIPNTAAVAKKELLYFFPFGFCAWLCGTVFINRSDSEKSRKQISALGESIKRSRTKLWIFPEGTRHKGTDLLPFKKGAFHIAVQHGLPIVPLVISPYSFIDDRKQYFGSGKMVISTLQPIETKGVTDINGLVESTRELMDKEYKRLGQLDGSGK